MKLFNQTDNLTGQRLICPILRSYIENKETEVIKIMIKTLLRERKIS
jgi:hypothetical protein